MSKSSSARGPVTARPTETTPPATHPNQPLVRDPEGVIRFKENAICRWLVDSGRANLNDLAHLPFSAEDHAQFAQLIGYSLGGWSELSYVTDAQYDAVASTVCDCRKSIGPCPSCAEGATRDEPYSEAGARLAPNPQNTTLHRKD